METAMEGAAAPLSVWQRLRRQEFDWEVALGLLNDTIGAIPRIRDIGPDPGMISDALLGVVAQRLVGQICPHCSVPYAPTQRELEILQPSPTVSNMQGWWQGRGCRRCLNCGYLGWEAVIEVLNVDETVRDLMHEGTITQLRRYLYKYKTEFESFRMAAIAEVTTGITTLTEITRVLPHSALFPRSLSQPPQPIQLLNTQS